MGFYEKRLNVLNKLNNNKQGVKFYAEGVRGVKIINSTLNI